MIKQKVIIRADGSSEIGYGHVHRMLSLVKILRDSFQCVFVSHEDTPFLLRELNTMNVPFVSVDKVYYPSTLLRKTGDEVAFDMDHILEGNEIVVTDGYWFGVQYHRSIKAKGCKSVCIDDEAAEHFYADVVINQSPGLTIDHYRGKGMATSFYLGIGYTLVSVPEIYRAKAPRVFWDLLIIGMGASDPFNFTCKILVDYKSFIARFKRVVVIVGQNFAHMVSLDKTVSGYSNVEIVRDLGKTEVYAWMEKASCAILSSSTMAIEYAQIGGVLAIVQTIANQKHLHKGLIREKVALALDDLLKNPVDEIGINLMENQKLIFDGKSSERILSIFFDLNQRFKIQMITAAVEHMDVTYRWASSAEIRRYSFNRNPISRNAHENWFQKKIQDKNCIYLIGIIDEQVIGSVRFDLSDETGEISYLVDPLISGKGFGKLLLAEGILSLIKLRLPISKIQGYVLPENTASVKIFERMGFEKELQTDRIRYYINLNQA